MSGGFPILSGASFWERGIGLMADGGHHGEGEHDERNVAMPAVPGSALVVVETEFVLEEKGLDLPPAGRGRD